MKKYIMIGIMVLLAGFQMKLGAAESQNKTEEVKGREFLYEINPETMELSVEADKVKEKASEALEKRAVKEYVREGNRSSWVYPDEGLKVSLTKEKEYLKVEMESEKAGEFNWPKVDAEAYTLPIAEGRYIPKNDKNWKKFLDGETYGLAESLSMQFFALNKKNYAIVYIIENMFNNEISFDTKNGVKFQFNHEFTSVNKEKKYGFRIYVTENNTVSIAKIYREYMMEQGKFKSFEEKRKENKNIEKLFGAPHIYLWGPEFIAGDNIRWQKFAAMSGGMEYLKNAIKLYASEGEAAAVELGKLKSQGYADKYQKNCITRAVNEVLLRKEFNPKNKNLSNPVEIYRNNKELLKKLMGESIDSIDKWGNGNSVELLKEMKSAGVDRAWLGFDGWETGYINPEFVEYANENGYLIGTYDSYHSIHAKGQEKWSTAAFADGTLYENATITDKKGIKITGFQGVGRKLNPTLSMGAVKERVEGILGTGVKFNSWFIDCDAAGELYDDYSKGTTQKQDMEARDARMAWIGSKGLVIGSELGNDYAAETITFAHGLETPVFGWGDKDMKDKNSRYFVGKYYAPNGGVPEIFQRETPLKELYNEVCLNPEYKLPLFKLVYNDSVITTHHWLWGTLKIKDKVRDRMLMEILYNTPPLYHIDKEAWKKYGDKIIAHHRVWSDFHKKAVTREMTNFEILREDKLVQMTQFGKGLKVVANFSDREFDYKGDKVKKHSLIIYDGDKKTEY